MSRGPQRADLLQEQIQRLLAQALTGIIAEPPDDALRFATITMVRLSSDKGSATVYYQASMNGPSQKDLHKIIQKHSGWLRAVVARELTARRAPRLVFKLDENLETILRVDALLDRIKAE